MKTRKKLYERNSAGQSKVWPFFFYTSHAGPFYTRTEQDQLMA